MVVLPVTMLLEPMLMALTISASERSRASVNTPAVRTVIPSAMVKSASRSSTTSSWAGLVMVLMMHQP
jgi:hypothetical protein